eukprot:TRINITY_DN36986_c0_g1_i1.p1 TRINITY_DN36986_c0_g1~~TRINITY_DN36986_c0_g1_i1.p1  ORF type:complete len:298 (-),score=63.03 TRINITY_DN36986_c0_g1_i1:89-982(-)
MPSLGDPAPAATWEARTAHGQTLAPSYVPAKAVAEVPPARGTVGTRRPEETRSCRMQVGAVPNAVGSAFAQQGNTKIIAAVYGPRQVLGDRQAGASAAEGFLNVDFQFSSFASRYTGKDENDKRALLYGTVLQRALESVVLLERYAKTAFDLSILVLEDDGAALTAALSAASLALADASVEMRDLAAGVTVHLAADDGSGRWPQPLLLDCDASEQASLPEGSAVLHLGLCPARGNVCMLHCAGPLPSTQLEHMTLLAKDTAEAIGTEIRRCLQHRVERRAEKRQRLAASAATETAAA